MQRKRLTSHSWSLKCSAMFLAGLQMFASCTLIANAQDTADQIKTKTPIKHVIVIIGENRTFDQIFATYKPKPGEKVHNLLSQGIVNADGTPGPNYALATQFTAVDSHRGGYDASPMSKSIYPLLPVPLAGGPTTPYVSTIAEAQAVENGLAAGYYKYLTTGGTGLKSGTPDTRVLNYNDLPPGPFQLTPGVAMTTTPPARCIVSFKCGRRWIAMLHTPLAGTPAAARPTCFRGSKQVSAQVPTASRSPCLSLRSRRAKAQPLWVSTTFNREMPPT